MIITRTVILGWMEFIFIYLAISYRTTLVIIFFVDSFVDCFLHELIDCCKKKKKILFTMFVLSKQSYNPQN